jgi:2-keto-3-deoxy-L-rhamnonate aldolase RhmA
MPEPLSFRERLRRGELLLGTMVTLPNASVAEILADCGFDWLFLDGEHGPLEPADVQSLLQAIAGKAACLVRVPEAAEAPIKKMLDVGAEGIIVPQVNTPQQAADCVRFARYAPDGARGVGLARAHGYGRRFREYVAAANDRTAVVVQAEHIRAVENIEEIVQVPGVDAVLLGPYDLSASLGKMGQVDDPSVASAIDRVIAACRAANMPLGYFGVTASAVQPYIDRGCRLITAGVDTLLLSHAAGQVLKQLRP